MLECHRLFMKIKALAAIFMATLTVLEAQQCYLKKFKNVTNGNQALPRSNITASYALGRLGECHILCTQRENCHGYNFRFRPSSKNIVNCQLSNSTEKWNSSKIQHGPWVYYQDVVIAEDINECSFGINECHTNASCSNIFGSYNCQCKNGYTGNGRTCVAIIPNSCTDYYKSGMRQDGVYAVNPDGLGSFQVRCDMTTNGGGWTVFQRRQDGSEDFYLGWSDYKAGFGDLNGEFWLGLDKIHRLAKSDLRVDLMDFNNAVRYAEYGTFSVADESDKYRLNIGAYTGDAGDSLAYHNQMQFSTKDNDNDKDSGNCATSWKGAWWYKHCHYSNLNGLYYGAADGRGDGIKWHNWHGYSMKKAQMKTRPSQF